MSRDLIIKTAKAIAFFLLLMIIPLLQAEGQICEKNDHSGIDECAPHNMLYVVFWNLSNIFDHHEGTVIGFATILLALITALLWDATRNLVHGAERTAERQLRAYVFIVDVGIADANSKHFSPRITVHYKNFGQTPASKVMIDVDPIFNFSGEARHRKKKPPEGTVEKGLIMGPGSPIYTSFPIASDFWAMVKSTLPTGVPKFFIIGKITYKDAFDGKRETLFKLLYKPGTKRVTNGKRFSFTEDGNSYT